MSGAPPGPRHRQHAMRAFAGNALDYLLKPFSDERFEAAMSRAKSCLDEQNLRDFGRRMLQMVCKIPAQSRRWDRLVVKSAGSTRFLRVAEIDWIDPAGVYATRHVARKEFLYRLRSLSFQKNLIRNASFAFTGRPS